MPDKIKDMPKQASREIYSLVSPILFEIPEGKKFVKEVIREGEWIHPQNSSLKFKVTLDRMKEWVNNFKNKVVDIVAVPIKHSDNPMDNTGIIEDLFISGKSLFAKFNITLNEVAEKIGKTILGCSVGIEKDYMNTETGENYGEVINHIALTNNPYIPGLGEFEATFSKDGNVINVLYFDNEKNLSQKNEVNKKGDAQMDELEKIKAEKIELEKKMSEQKAEFEKQKAEFELVKNTSIKAESEKIDLAKKIEAIEQTNFEREIKSEVELLSREGKILPAEKEEKSKFAISLGKEKSKEYIAMLQKEKPKVDVTTLSRNDGKDNFGGDMPKISEIKKLYQDFATRKIDRVTFEKSLNDWAERYEKSGKYCEGDTQVVHLSRK